MKKKLVSFVEKLAQKSGKYISYAKPLLDAALPDGSIDYEEPTIYKENGIVKTGKIGEFIDKFYEGKEITKPVLVPNIEVPAFDQKTFKINWKKVDYVYRHKINEDLFELELEFGRKIKLTGCHSLFALGKEGVKAVRTDNLKVGDYAIIPIAMPENDSIKEINLAEEISKTEHSKQLILDNVPIEIYASRKNEIYSYLKNNYKKANQAFYEHKNKNILPLSLHNLLTREQLEKCTIRPTSAIGIKPILGVNKELMRFLGLYIAEGWLYDYNSTYGTQFALNKKEDDLIEAISKSAKLCFDLDISKIEKDGENGIKVNINSYALWVALSQVLKLSKGAKKKRIPELIFNVSKDLQTEFLKYWSLGDYGSTSSKDLQNEISYLSIFNKNVVAFYDREREVVIDERKIKSREFYTNFFVRDVKNPYPSMIPIELFNPLTKTHHRLRNKRLNRDRLYKIINEERYNKFLNLSKISDKKFIKEWEKRGFIKDKRLTENGEELLKEMEIVNKLIDSDLGFARIVKINKVKPTKEFVYDFSVKDHENFIGGTGGICCHNSRVNATYTQEISSRGPTFTIRKFTKEPFSPIKLMQFNTASPELLAYLWILIEHEANIMVIGGTGSGKTSLLNSIAFFIPPQARVVSIEDTRELQLLHENWLPSVSRESIGIGESESEIDLFALLKESFRQRPDYVIVGEIRGKEAYVLFQGAASGHPTMSTMHAEDVETMIKRLETQPINLSPSLIEVLDAVCIMTQAKVKNQEVRRVREVAEIVGLGRSLGDAVKNTPFIWEPRTDTFFFKIESKVFEKIMRNRGLSKEYLEREFRIRSQLLMSMYRHGIFGFKEAQDIIHAYYKTPKLVMKEFNINI